MESNCLDNCVHCYNIKILNLFFLDPELQLTNTKAMIKYKLKELLLSGKSLKF